MEESHQILFSFDCLEDVKRHKESEDKGIIFTIREGNHHERVPGPDMKVVGLHAKLEWCDKDSISTD